MISHAELIKLIIAYTITGVILFTAIVTCLSLVGWIKIVDSAVRKTLYTTLITSSASLGIGIFTNLLNINPASTAEAIQAEERANIASNLLQNIVPAENLSDMQIFNPARKAEISKTLSIVKTLTPKGENPEVDSLINYLNNTPTNFSTRADSANFAKKVGNQLSNIRTMIRPKVLNRPD